MLAPFDCCGAARVLEKREAIKKASRAWRTRLARQEVTKSLGMMLVFLILLHEVLTTDGPFCYFAGRQIAGTIENILRFWNFQLFWAASSPLGSSCDSKPRISIMSKALKKVVEEARDNAYTELDLADRELKNLTSVPILLQLRQLTKLTLSHNKLTAIPPSIVDLYNLEHLNLFNNFVEELPTSISTLSKLKTLNVGVNRLSSLPRGLGSLPSLEILDLTYNNLSENSLPANFFLLADSLRALYLGDNDFETLPADFGKLTNLQVLVLRDNDLVELPPELSELTKLKELHLQNNRLTALPPALGTLQLGEQRHVFKAEGNSWIQAIQDQLVLGPSHVFETLKTDAYKILYEKHVASGIAAPPKNEKEKTLKRSRKKVP